MIRNQTGQSIIETLIAAKAILLCIFVVTALVYRGTVYFAARQSINELLYCSASLRPAADCEKEFKNKLKAFLIFHESSNLSVNKSAEEIRASVEIHAWGTPDLKIDRHIRLPLFKNLRKDA